MKIYKKYWQCQKELIKVPSPGRLEPTTSRCQFVSMIYDRAIDVEFRRWSFIQSTIQTKFVWHDKLNPRNFEKSIYPSFNFIKSESEYFLFIFIQYQSSQVLETEFKQQLQLEFEKSAIHQRRLLNLFLISMILILKWQNNEQVPNTKMLK